MAETTHHIVCLIEGDPDPLVVAVSMDMRVFMLKRLIKEEGDLRDIRPDKLVVWKLKVPLPVIPNHTLAERVDFNNLHLIADRLELIDIMSDIFPEPIPIEELHVLVTRPSHYKRSLVPSITSKLQADRIDYYKWRSKASPSSLGKPSTFVAEQTHSHGPAFYFDRPAPAAGTIPVTLLHPILAQFKDDCTKRTPGAADAKLALEISNEMSQIYVSEESRKSTFQEIMTQNGLDMCTNGFSYCLVEGENEIGSGGAEPVLQAVAYYAQLMENASTKHPRARLPALLIYLAGAHVGFAGAVFTNRPNLQILVNPLALFSHYTNIGMRTTVAQYFGALRKAIHSLREHYISFPSTIDPTDHPGFPYMCHYKSLIDGKTHSFTYEKQIDDKLVFVGKADDGDRICIKFVHTYSTEAHSECARVGFAPSLKGFEELPSQWYMVVMEEIDSSFQHFSKSYSTPALYESTKQKIIELHEAGFVHGDIRDVNFFVKEDSEDIMLVDFNWAGRIGEVKYPLYLNLVDIWRPDDARDGRPILADHDISMLDVMFGKKGLE